MKAVYLYIHSHWDREWYRPFEAYRTDLLPVVRAVVRMLECGELPSFYMDGQSLAIDDAVEVDPSLAPRIKTLIEQGKLSAGPWYVLADQMLVCGESLIRNLLAGTRALAPYGGAAAVGYCPDTFGHSQDLPRILAGFGIGTAVVWRGVPPAVGQPAFRWISPDGSTVLAYHLRRGYYQQFLHETRDAGRFADHLAGWLLPDESRDGQSSACDALAGGALYPCGGDHAGPFPEMAAIIDRAGRLLRERYDAELRVVLLGDFLASVSEAARAGKLDEVRGELRDNSAAGRFARAFLLPGVLSSRLYLKRENRAAEHRLFAMSEPVAAVLAARGVLSYPALELDRALRLILQNHPHDSICGCSVDEVHEDMMARSRGANQILDALDLRARDAVARFQAQCDPCTHFRDPAFGAAALCVINTATEPDCAPVRLSWTEDPAQPLAFGKGQVQVISRQRREELFAGLGAPAYYKDVFAVDGWIWPAAIEGLSLASLAWPLAGPGDGGPPPASAAGRRLTNGLVTVEVDAFGQVVATVGGGDCAQAAYRIGHNLRDVGDGGDTYNFCRLAGDEPLHARFKSVKAGLRGPLVASLLLTYELDIPDGLVECGPGEEGLPALARSGRLVRQRIVTAVSLRRGVPIVYFETTWENRADDHRLEVVFETGAVVTETVSENHFSVVRRRHAPLPAAGPAGAGEEVPPDRYPCQRFFLAGGQVFLNGGLPEYGVDGSRVTITLLRAVSNLSRGRIACRGGGAGPHMSVPGANCRGMNRATYGWAALAGAGGDGLVSGAYKLAERFEGRLWAAPAAASFAAAPLLSVPEPSVRLVALFATGNDGIIARLLNTGERDLSLPISFAGAIQSAEICSLDGKTRSVLALSPAEPGRKRASIDFGPWQLLTLRLALSADRTGGHQPD